MDVIRTLKSRLLRPRLSNDVLARGDRIGSDRSGRSNGDTKCSNPERMNLHVMVSVHSLQLFLPYFNVIAVELAHGQRTNNNLVQLERSGTEG
jgi:hypothetical protein